MQMVASITTKKTEKDKTETTSGSSEKGSSAASLRDELHLLGTVTDKIVVTPDFHIGQRAVTSTSSPPSSSSLKQEAGSAQEQEDTNPENRSSSGGSGSSSSGIMGTFQEEATKTMRIKNEVL